MSKRIKTKYPGVFYREAKRLGGKGTERVYYVVFKKDGKTIEEKAGRQFADGMTAARAAGYRSERIEGKRLSRKELREKAEKAHCEAQNRMTFDRLWALYVGNRPELKGIVTDQNRYLNHIKPAFGNKEPKEILALDLDRLRLRLLKTKAPATVRNVLELLRRIVNFGVKKNLCEGLRFSIQMPRVNNEKTEDLSPDQLTCLLEAIEDEPNIQVANLMKMALFTGMRRGELFKLCWEDIDFDRKYIWIREPKGGRDKKIPLNEAAEQLLSTHPRTYGSPYVFPGRGGRRRVDCIKQVNKIKERAGLPSEFRAMHGLRHVYASALASTGQVDMLVLQKLLTHSSPQMTQRYAHLRDEALNRASELASEIFSSYQVPNTRSG